MSKQDLEAAAAGAVLVGVDDSMGGRAAMGHALREAAHRGLPVLAITVFSSPDAWAPEVAALIDPERLRDEVRRATQRVVDEVVAEQRAEGIDVGEVRVGIRSGAPADVLSGLSRHAALLVVGHRGRGALATRLIGSVGLGVVVHAQCPVLVVRPVSTTAASSPV